MSAIVNWVLMSFDTLDVVMITLIVVAGSYFYFKYQSDLNEKTLNNNNNNTNMRSLTTQKTYTTFLERMKSENRQILILFGSQTGTAEELAGRLAKDLSHYGQKPLVIDPEELEVEELPNIIELTNPILLLCVATYGEGDPTDNAQNFYRYFIENEFNLNGLHYAVFGLGNKTYEHYNAVGKYFDHRLEELGAKRVFELGLGDDDANLEEDFMRWREAFLTKLSQKFGWEFSNKTFQRQYQLEIIDKPTKIFTGEYGRIGAFEQQKPPFDQKNPYLSKIVEKYALHSELSTKKFYHIELGINPQFIRYEAGDHVGIFPKNNDILVEKIGKLLKINLDIVIKLVDNDLQSSKPYLFPCPCSYRTALRHYVDICAPVKSHVLRALSEVTNDEKQKNSLFLLSTASKEGLKEYHEFIQKSRRNIVDVLEHFNTCKPPLDLLLELLPRLQARYYSISSSPKKNDSCISVTVAVLQYNVENRDILGVCTNYLADKKINDYCPIFLRKSTMRLPRQITTPIIMIGPGTGVAPFRGFLYERLHYKKLGKEVGENVLYFGCRYPDKDYLYKTEFEDFEKNGLLTEFYVAFSRVNSEKCYVQHKMWENRERLWKLIFEKQASIYVCGDAKNMARDVQNTFLKIFEEIGRLDKTATQKYLKELERQKRYQTDVWS